MGRTARPWYFTENKAYAATVKGRRVILLKGEQTPANERKAAAELRKVLAGSRNDGQAGIACVNSVTSCASAAAISANLR